MNDDLLNPAAEIIQHCQSLLEETATLSEDQRQCIEMTAHAAKLFSDNVALMADIIGRMRNDREFANISHEFRGPIMPMIGYSEIILKRLFGTLNDSQQEHLTQINQTAKSLLELVNSIMDGAKQIPDN